MNQSFAIALILVVSHLTLFTCFEYTLENTEGAIINGQSRETGNIIGYGTQDDDKHHWHG